MALDSLFRLALIALLAACVPLGIWALRSRGLPPGRRLALLSSITLFLTLDLIAFGAFTRLTDSGLGCPDWPGCYGLASPHEAGEQIRAAQAQLPQGPVTWAKAWIEMLHRYLAMAVGVLILLNAVAAWRHRAQLPHSPLWAWLTLAAVVVQGLFGKYTVTLKLYPAVVTLHLLGAVGLLVLLAVQQASFTRAAASPARPLPLSLRRLLVLSLCLLAVQIGLGGWVSTNYAVLVCQGFPTCNDSWWPAMAWLEGFAPLRELGRNAQGQLLSFNALVAIHWTHRLFAGVVLLLLGGLAFRLAALPDWRHSGRWLAALLTLQLITGLSNVVLGWPLAAALLHTSGAAAMAAILARLVARDRWLKQLRSPA